MVEQLNIFKKKRRKASDSDIIFELKNFNEFGKKTEFLVRNGISYFVNEYWTSGQRKTNSIHEISYRACFKAQLPEFFIERLTKEGDAVHDPFMGRGTTPIQAALMDRQAFGNDINPLSIILTRPRMRTVNTQEVSNALKTIDFKNGEILRKDLLTFYHKKTLIGLEALKKWLNINAPLSKKNPNPIADWIRMIAINRLSGHSPGFFSGRSMPPNQAVSIKAQQKINDKLGLRPPAKDIEVLINKKTNSLLKKGCFPRQANFSLHVGSATNTPKIKNSSIDLVVTSPPFLDIVDYAADNWLRCWFAGIDPSNVNISAHKTKEDWTEMVHNVLKEQARIVKSGGYIAFEVGEVRNKSILLEDLVWTATEGLPFHRLGVMINQQNFTKTANLWGINNGTKGTNTNRIVLLRRK